ncbi:MAG: Gfo/Idh/MocA family oxidoreductase, partial [Rhodospirillaceae bacterium]
LANKTVDGVIVSTPTAHHCQPVLAALDAGVPVLVEKPITATVADAERICAASARTGVPVLVGHQRRYYGFVAKAREIVRSGRIGRLVAVTGQWTSRKDEVYYEPDWRKQWEAGPILTNLIHEMDLLRFICGEVASLSADVSHAVRGWDKEDTAAMTLAFKDGALGTFVLSDQTASPWTFEFGTGESVLFPKSGQNSMRFMGTTGALEFPNLVLWHHGDETADWNHLIGPEPMPMALDDAYVLQIAHFAAVIAGEAAALIDAADATQTLLATLAVFEAAKTGRRVSL